MDGTVNKQLGVIRKERNVNITKFFALQFLGRRIRTESRRIMAWTYISPHSRKVELEKFSRGDQHGAP
jgi:hypothetical protein